MGDVDVKLLNPTCNSEIEGSVVIDTLTRSIVEDSDETEGNTTLIVKEDKENEKIVEKDLSQDIDNKHQIVRKEITVAASDDLYFPTTESQDPTTITDNMLDEDISKIKSKGNESVQDVDVKLLNPTCNSEIEGSVVIDTLTRSI